MYKCAEYEKYFHDFNDNILSAQKREEYEKHLHSCEVCREELRLHKKYLERAQEEILKEVIPDDISIRFKNKLEYTKQEAVKARTIGALGLLPLDEVADVFELNKEQIDTLIDSPDVIRIRKIYYIKKESALDVILELLQETSGQVDYARLAGFSLADKLNFHDYHEIFLARRLHN